MHDGNGAAPQIIPSQTKPGQANPSKNAWICLVLFVRFRTFQWVLDKDRVAGSATQVKGAVKEAVGKVVGDAKLEAEGKADKAEGKAQNAVGGLKDAVRDAAR